MSKIKIFSLGGLNENGKNMYVVDVNNDIFIFDAGLKYANEKMLGVDYIIPDYNFIKENKKNIKGIFITHGHDENMGALVDIITEVKDIDVYSCKFTCDIIRRELEEAGLKFDNLHEIEPHKVINFGKNSVFPVSLTHSIPDNVGYVLNTEDNKILMEVSKRGIMDIDFSPRNTYISTYEKYGIIKGYYEAIFIYIFNIYKLVIIHQNLTTCMFY